MVVAGARGKWGFGKETTFAAAAAATDWPVIKKLSSHPVVAQLAEEGFRQSAAKTRGLQNGPVHTEIDISGDVYADTIGFPLVGVMGADTVTGASPVQHAVSLLASGQPPSYTLTDSESIQLRQFTGVRFSDVSFKFAAGGLLTYEAKAVGATQSTNSDVAASYTSLAPPPSYAGVVLIAGAAFAAMTDGQIDLKRTVNAVDTIDGTPAPYTVFSDFDFTATGQFTAVMEDETLYNHYLNGDLIAFDISWSQGAGAGLNLIQFHMSQMKITDATLDRSASYVGIQCTFEGVANTTDVGPSGGDSPCAVTLKNAIPAGRYA
jgi:hypothetical protein